MTEGLKPLTVLSEGGRVLYNSELAEGLRDGVDEDLRDRLVRSRLEALIEGEGLTQRSLGQHVDEALKLVPAKDGKPASYRAINEYFSGERMRGGWSAKYVAAMETSLLKEVAEYFLDPASTQEAVRGGLTKVEVLREFLHRADEIMIGYAMAGAKKPALQEYYGAPLADDYTPFKEKGVMVAERTTRAVVGIYVYKASASAWEQGLRQEYLAHQACMGLFRAFVDHVARLPEMREHNPVERAANIILGAMKSFATAFRTPLSRGVDPVTGPRPGLIIDPFLAYPSWRQFAYGRRAKERPYLKLFGSQADKDHASLHTIQKVREAADSVTRKVYQRVAKYALETEDWRRIPLSEEDKLAVTADHLDRHFPGFSTLQCDGEAICRMFGDNITVDLSAGEREHREKFVRKDPVGFAKSERSIQNAWEVAIDLAEAKVRALGVTGDRSIMICLHAAIAVEIFSYIEDPRFQVNTPDNNAYTPDDTAVFARAMKVVEQLARAVWRERETENAL